MGRPLVAKIFTQALKDNCARIKHLAPGKKIMAMVKANGYGHGLVKVAKALEQADAFGVACIEEAIQLRQEGIDKPIVLMEGFFDSQELLLIQDYDLTMVIHTSHQLDHVLSTKLDKSLSVWLKLNTGMNRLGLPVSEAKTFYQKIHGHPQINLIGFMGHFAQADNKSKGVTLEQAQTFMSMTEGFPVERSLANSAAILGWPMTHCDWIRPGLALYGASPFADNSLGRDFGLVPAMELSSQIIAIQKVEPGDQVGYGGTWTANAPARIGIVAIGYGDGYPWHAKNSTPVWVRTKLVPLVGRVSMDMVAIDLSACSHATVGDEVRLWGKEVPVEQVAKYAGTVPYELFCRLTERVRIEYV